MKVSVAASLFLFSAASLADNHMNHPEGYEVQNNYGPGGPPPKDSAPAIELPPPVTTPLPQQGEGYNAAPPASMSTPPPSTTSPEGDVIQYPTPPASEGDVIQYPTPPTSEPPKEEPTKPCGCEGGEHSHDNPTTTPPEQTGTPPEQTDTPPEQTTTPPEETTTEPAPTTTDKNNDHFPWIDINTTYPVETPTTTPVPDDCPGVVTITVTVAPPSSEVPTIPTNGTTYNSPTIPTPGPTTVLPSLPTGNGNSSGQVPSPPSPPKQSPTDDPLFDGAATRLQGWTSVAVLGTMLGAFILGM